MTGDNRVRVKGAHGLRGSVARTTTQTDERVVLVQLDDHTGPTPYLAEELESESKPCSCMWCAP